MARVFAQAQNCQPPESALAAEMLAVRWHARGDVRVEEVPPPAPPGPGELQLQVRWCGICGTDLEGWLSGPVFIPAAAPHPLTGARAPFILGHEFVGVVVAVGAGGLKISRVTLCASCSGRYRRWQGRDTR